MNSIQKREESESEWTEDTVGEYTVTQPKIIYHNISHHIQSSEDFLNLRIGQHFLYVANSTIKCRLNSSKYPTNNLFSPLIKKKETLFHALKQAYIEIKYDFHLILILITIILVSNDTYLRG